MRNLRSIRYAAWRSPQKDEHRQITATAWDVRTDSVICAYGPTENDPLIELVRVTFGNNSDSSDHNFLTSWDAPSPNPDMTHDKIISLHHFLDTSTVCLVLTGGDIIIVREDAVKGKYNIEIVGSVDVGITAAKWSPDEELLAISTKADTFLFMSRSFDGVMDVEMGPDDLKASNHVSVGWGKKETQFTGKGVKVLRDPTVPEKVDEGVLCPHDNGGVAISWRGDDAYVAVSTIESGARRLIRVYSRDGILESVSEPVDGLVGALSWRPAGNLIAGIQRFSDHVDVVFFERNGLRHGQFSLRLSPEEVTSLGGDIQLSWNHDSSVMAVLLGNDVQLWTMGNYHWYLKQVLVISPETSSDIQEFIQEFIWHPETALLFVVATKDRLVSAEYTFYVTRGSTSPAKDIGAVAVIDGKEIRLTAFRAANIPPPMALHVVSVSNHVSDVAFNFDNSLIAVSTSDGILVYRWDVRSKACAPPDLKGRFIFKENGLRGKAPLQICFDGNQDVLGLQHSNEGKIVLHRYRFSEETDNAEEQVLASPSISPTMRISSFDQEGVMHPFIQHASGLLYSLRSESNSVSSIDFKFPLFLPWIELIVHNEKHLAFGLSKNGHLYANTRLLVKNCTSFVLTPSHLAFTTTTHLLKFVHIADIEDLEVPPDDPEKDERCRSIERGARLITAMPTSLSLVLQMPRGNLETIWPRAMVLAGIRNLIDEKRYKEAYSHCRTQRVDMNILYDHSPDLFMSNVGLFIDQVKKTTYIDLFLSSLREEDVSQTLYKETRRPRNQVTNAINVDTVDGIHSPNNPPPILKVNRICEAFLEVLKDRTSTNLQSIITANVCKIPPALEDGLLVVAGLMAEKQELAEKAIEHICFLVDVNKLYDTALGLYNLDLALLVAQQSQKDPREYLPFLQNLQELPRLRRYFSIDDYLGRHSKALSHLHELSLSDHLELEAYTVKHALYQHALTLYQYRPARLDSIMSLYASYLESQSQFHEAAIAFEHLQLYEPASACYQRASPHYWRECISCASQQSPRPSQDAMASLTTSLADSLSEVKDYESAAYIHATYLSSVPAAVVLLCKGYHFASAIQLASRHIPTHPSLLAPNGPIDAGLSDNLSASTELLAECKSQLLAQVPRIVELRLKAEAEPLAFYEGEVNEDLPDDASVAASSRLSTSASLFTRYTGRQSLGTAATGQSRATSKNRRREERKRARGKKGSVYEEEYLVASLGRLVDRVERARTDIEKLVIGLLRRRMRERAKAIETLLVEVVGMCGEAVKNVFGDEAKEMMTKVERNGYRPIGGAAVLAESIEASRERRGAPHIGAIHRLSLLGPEE